MTKTETHIKYGFISGIGIVALMFIFYITGWVYKPNMQYIQYLSYVPFLVGIVMNAIAFSKANDGYVTFGNVFGSCFKATLIIALVVIAWTILSVFAFPDMKEKALTLARDQMINGSQKMTDDQMDMALNVSRKYYTTIMVASAIFGTLISGALFSLIGAAVAKKKGERPVSATNF
jgi:hypothetical protein